MESINPTHTGGGSGSAVEFSPTPDTCPHCKHSVEPRRAGAAAISAKNSHKQTALEIAFQCPRTDCGRLFVAQYSPASPSNHSFRLAQTIPASRQVVEVPNEIDEISDRFRDILQQATDAESYGLDLIAGGGFRKALEFLIKDYCIHRAPDRADEIRKKFLGACIAQDVDNQNIKECAKRAAWLGNDETHYERRWQGKDIKDLKTLIALTVNWIQSSLLTEQYLQEMQT